MGALVQQVGDVLDRGHALFGEPQADGRVAARDAGRGLGSAGHVLGRGRVQLGSQRGLLATRYDGFASDAGPALAGAEAADEGLGDHLHDAASADRSGRRDSRAVLDGAANDVKALGPSSRTAVGQRAIMNALRARVFQQQHVIAAYTARDARLAAVLRSLSYRGAAIGRAGAAIDGIPLSGSGFAGMASPLTAFASTFDPTRAASAGMTAPGRPVGTPLGALTLTSGPREVASAIIHEAQRRGYSPTQTTAILADAIQESNLNPRARSPNGLWESVFQQDASYPGRRNPNIAISEFFNRLDRHGGPGSANIWHSIFWLQQRPGDPSAEAAVARGRRRYLAEIMGRHAEAAALYRDITAI